MKMNKKAMGPSETLVDVWSWVVWAFVIVIFIILFNLRACTNDFKASDQTIQGQIHSDIPEFNLVMTYLNTPLDYCSIAKYGSYDKLTPAELVNYFIKGKPRNLMPANFDGTANYATKFQNSDYARSFLIWHDCISEFFTSLNKVIKYNLYYSNSDWIYSSLFSRGTDEILIPTDEGYVKLKYQVKDK